MKLLSPKTKQVNNAVFLSNNTNFQKFRNLICRCELYLENEMFGSLKSNSRSLILEEIVEPYMSISIKSLNLVFALGVILIKILHCDHIEIINQNSASTVLFHKQLVKIFQNVVMIN
jgi:hypothetical protein